MNPPEETKPAKVRAKAEYLVQQRNRTSAGWSDSTTTPLVDTKEGVDWIKQNGESGESYRVVRVCSGPHIIKIETKERRTLT